MKIQNDLPLDRLTERAQKKKRGRETAPEMKYSSSNVIRSTDLYQVNLQKICQSKSFSVAFYDSVFFRLLRVPLDQPKVDTIYQHLLILAVAIIINQILTQDQQESTLMVVENVSTLRVNPFISMIA
jgi:hypothetical protein